MRLRLSSVRSHITEPRLLLLTLLALVMLLSLEVAAATPPAGLRVMQALPSGALKKAGDANEIRIQFDKPVVAMKALSERPAVEQFVKIDPPLPGEFHWGSTRLLIFTPKPLPPLSSRFTVTVSGLKAMDGSEIKEPYRFWFETPRVSCRLEWNGMGFYSGENNQIYIICDQPVTGEDLARHVELRYLTIHHPSTLTDVEPSPEDWKKMTAVDPSGAKSLRTALERYRGPVQQLATSSLKLIGGGITFCYADVGSVCYRFNVKGEIPRDVEIEASFRDGMTSPLGPLPSHDIAASHQKSNATLLMHRPECDPLCNPSALSGFKLSPPDDNYYFDNDPPWLRYDRRISITDLTESGPPQIYHAPDKDSPKAEKELPDDPLALQWAIFKPHHTYEIRFQPHTEFMKKNRRLGLEYTSITTLTMANYPAYAVIRSDESVLEPRAGSFDIYLRNVTRLRTATARIEKQDLIKTLIDIMSGRWHPDVNSRRCPAFC